MTRFIKTLLVGGLTALATLSSGAFAHGNWRGGEGYGRESPYVREPMPPRPDMGRHNYDQGRPYYEERTYYRGYGHHHRGWHHEPERIVIRERFMQAPTYYAPAPVYVPARPAVTISVPPIYIPF